MNNDQSLNLHTLELLQQRLGLEPTVTKGEGDDSRDASLTRAPAASFLTAPAHGFLAA